VLVGVCALLCLFGAAAMWIFTADPESNLLVSALMRVGVVLGSLWFVLPAKGESIAWDRALPVLVIVLVLAAFLRRAFFYLVPVLLAIGLAVLYLRPKPKRRPGR
jgi:Ca2+/Na+ antiporter